MLALHASRESKEAKAEEEEGLLLQKGESVSFRSTSTLSKCARWLSILVGLALTFVFGLLLGRSQRDTGISYGLPDPPGSIQNVWHHNLTFTQKPDVKSEAAWSSIIPIGRGFVTHDQLAPAVSNIAVFHQLHCLHAIVVAYYNALESPPQKNATEIPEFDDLTGTRTAIFHVRHCFDYLRQTLMCAADTNLEVLDPITHTTNGWDQPKQCRDYESIFKWAEKYANSTDTGIVT